MGTVFISHSSHDQSLASRLAGDLRQSGHSVWLDQSDLPAGASLAGSIQAGIAQSDAFVLLFSEQALNSGWVELEWQAALERKVADSAYTFLLCRLGDAEVPLILRGRKWIELRDEAEYALAVDAIRGSLVPPAPTTKAAPVVWYFDDVQESLDAFAERH
ncbi:MAG: toll/interleukin-1 receptor domain-containing protein, partial [Actinomycetota bacterium]|nr:toll/interleukin-1 receptor domain-containing protein [Actinomycetota bacterium]